MAQDLKGCLPVGGELGTSTSKFCLGEDIVTFSSVVGDALSDGQEKAWRLMNRSQDQRWIHNLSIFDEKRHSWRYVGAITRNSGRVNWFTSQGLIRNYDDAFLGIQAGLFCLNAEREVQGKNSLRKVSLGFGIPVRLGERTTEDFFNYLKTRLAKKDRKKYLLIKAKNLATGETRELKIEILFMVIQYQAYGGYMALLFKKYKLKVFNTYVIDIGHGTWIKLPIIENEADLNLSDSFPEGIYTVTQNISQVIFESSKQKFKIPEQRVMEKLPTGDYKIEVPGVGVYDFGDLLKDQTNSLTTKIIQEISADISTLSQKGNFIDYFVIIGGGAHLMFESIAAQIAKYYGWDQKLAKERIINPQGLGINPRYINVIGFMLLARDQLAIEEGKEVNTKFSIKKIIEDM